MDSVLTYVSSDHHMMNGSIRDDFAPYKTKFLESIQRIKPNSKVILLGDVFDCWRVKHSRQYQIFQEYQDIIEALKPFNPILVVGNHEDSVDNVRSFLPEEFRICERTIEDRLYFCHGHEFDWANKKNSFVGKMLTGIASCVGRINSVAEDKLADWAKWIQGIGRYSRKGKFVKAVEAHFEYFDGIDGVVCGHLHQYFYERMLGKKTIACCGTWPNNGWLIFKDSQFVGYMKNG